MRWLLVFAAWLIAAAFAWALCRMAGKAERRAENPFGELVMGDARKHGTRYCYKMGCRLAECREAKNVADRDYADRKLKKPIRSTHIRRGRGEPPLTHLCCDCGFPIGEHQPYYIHPVAS